jgi:polygalacturonase
LQVQLFADSSENVCIEDCYISVGDDAISIKSGWDEYGIAFGRPSKNIFIRRVVAWSPTSAGIAIGSEMSGGVANVSVDNMTIMHSRTGFCLKTATGRGGYVTNISVSNIVMQNVTTALAFTGQYGDHPDESYDPNAYPNVDQIAIRNLQGASIHEAGTLFGISGAPFRNICLAEIVLNVSGAVNWNCSDVEGYYKEVSPLPCSELLKDSGQITSTCSSHYQPGGCLQHSSARRFV